MAQSKVVVVTGAASGIGAATVRALTASGAEIHALDVKLPEMILRQYVRCDLADPASIDHAVSLLPPAIDGLVNVAGVPGPEPADHVLAVNFLGLRMLCEALLPRLRTGGSIVNVASIAGRDWPRRADVVMGLLDTPDYAAGLAWAEAHRARWARDPYTFSKQCVAAYSQRLAGAALRRKVRCNAVSPGGVETPLTPDFTRQMGEAQVAWIDSQVGRRAEPAEIAEVIAYVALGPCRWLNGADIPVDNGYTAGLATGWIDVSQSPAAQARAAAASART